MAISCPTGRPLSVGEKGLLQSSRASGSGGRIAGQDLAWPGDGQVRIRGFHRTWEKLGNGTLKLRTGIVGPVGIVLCHGGKCRSPYAGIALADMYDYTRNP